jgi:hypothetical protein
MFLADSSHKLMPTEMVLLIEVNSQTSSVVQLVELEPMALVLEELVVVMNRQRTNHIHQAEVPDLSVSEAFQQSSMQVLMMLLLSAVLATNHHHHIHQQVVLVLTLH